MLFEIIIDIVLCTIVFEYDVCVTIKIELSYNWVELSRSW